MLLAERLGARSWPAAVAWASVFPAVFILEVVLWGSGAPGPPQITFVGAFVAASVLLVNRWYFPKVELFFAGAQSDRQVPLLSGSRSQKAMARGDLAAIILWILLSLSANLYDWEGGNFCWFPNSGSLRL